MAGRRWSLILILGFTGCQPSSGESAESLLLGDHYIVLNYGFSEGGNRLKYLVVRSWPKDSSSEERLRDTRMQIASDGSRLVRGENGSMTPPQENGTVYFFEGNTLKLMRVKMSENTDTAVLRSAKSLSEIWTLLQRFRINGNP